MNARDRTGAAAVQMRPGRVCPLHDRYAPAVFDRPAALRTDVRYVAGGLYGHAQALDAGERLGAAQRSAAWSASPATVTSTARSGVVTRIGSGPAPARLAPRGTRTRGAHMDALRPDYDADAFVRDFPNAWPEGSPAHLSYWTRIAYGPRHHLDRARPRSLA